MGIVEAHGGSIECCSERERGNTFTAYVPAIVPEPAPDES